MVKAGFAQPKGNMTIKELIRNLQDFPENTRVCIVSADLGYGGDTYAPLDDIRSHNNVLLLGSTFKLCGTIPTPETHL